MDLKHKLPAFSHLNSNKLVEETGVRTGMRKRLKLPGNRLGGSGRSASQQKRDQLVGLQLTRTKDSGQHTPDLQAQHSHHSPNNHSVKRQKEGM
ncbi:hypothetical protein NQZ68_007459 [Dissostichus eleginoides]|nr:hypothetical protein NQZ68_007459 [Dissostichus eleginoides]